MRATRCPTNGAVGMSFALREIRNSSGGTFSIVILPLVFLRLTSKSCSITGGCDWMCAICACICCAACMACGVCACMACCSCCVSCPMASCRCLASSSSGYSLWLIGSNSLSSSIWAISTSDMARYSSFVSSTRLSHQTFTMPRFCKSASLNIV